MVLFKRDTLGFHNLDSKTPVQLFLHAISTNEFYIKTGMMQILFSFSFLFMIEASTSLILQHINLKSITR